jgi:hypothetical protein
VALMVLTFLIGTFVLMFLARNEGIQDLTVGRAIAASALLAFIPPSLFVLCYLVIPVFIALKLFAGVSLFWISARMITMGFLEVMESKATEVMISFYALMLLVVVVAWIYMTWGTG